MSEADDRDVPHDVAMRLLRDLNAAETALARYQRVVAEVVQEMLDNVEYARNGPRRLGGPAVLDDTVEQWANTLATLCQKAPSVSPQPPHDAPTA